MKIIAVGPMGWGKGDNLIEAIEHCSKNMRTGVPHRACIIAFLTDDEAYVNEIGGLCHKEEVEPIQLGWFNAYGKLMNDPSIPQTKVALSEKERGRLVNLALSLSKLEDKFYEFEDDYEYKDEDSSILPTEKWRYEVDALSEEIKEYALQ